MQLLEGSAVRGFLPPRSPSLASSSSISGSRRRRVSKPAALCLGLHKFDGPRAQLFGQQTLLPGGIGNLAGIEAAHVRGERERRRRRRIHGHSAH
ncbi:hypothetical protein BRADI_5g12675v3 [Brachypodium distachyon]|uniref:Uncharacterized protein n=1 Tax=Brachypodium distachyon TaxID=15368 RepID=A0A2K2CGT8_BRADI|nr:hypothetical protein BRADI_5g12675v3 [Brachypodium distachyon]